MGLCCELCFGAKLKCTLTDKIVLNIPAPPAGDYWQILTRSDGKVYAYKYTYAAGDFEIDPANFPAGVLNQHGGKFTLEIRKTDISGELLNLKLSDNYLCAELEFVSGSYEQLEIGVA